MAELLPQHRQPYISRLEYAEAHLRVCCQSPAFYYPSIADLGMVNMVETGQTGTAFVQEYQQMAILRFASSQQGTNKTPTWQKARFCSVCPGWFCVPLSVC